MSQNLIHVPYDFSPVAESAVDHACGIAKIYPNTTVELMHVVAKESDVSKSTLALKEAADRATAKYGIPVSFLIKVGSIFTEIGTAAAERSAKLIVMGTHGVKGLQYVFGSNALKVVTNSAVPFIVVQEKPFGNGYKNMVLPVDLGRDAKQNLSISATVAKVFGSKVHICYYRETDEFFARHLDNNVKYIQNFFNQEGIANEVIELGSKASFVKDMLAYAVKTGADMINMVNSHDTAVSMMGGSTEQTLLANEPQIPVLIVNERLTGFFGNVIFN